MARIEKYIAKRCSTPNPDTGCIIWTGSIDIQGGGYPRMWISGLALEIKELKRNK